MVSQSIKEIKMASFSANKSLLLLKLTKIQNKKSINLCKNDCKQSKSDESRDIVGFGALAAGTVILQ